MQSHVGSFQPPLQGRLVGQVAGAAGMIGRSESDGVPLLCHFGLGLGIDRLSLAAKLDRSPPSSVFALGDAAFIFPCPQR